MATPQKISADLLQTVSTHKNISNVYFTANGNYYFNAFTVLEKQKDGSVKPVQYARTQSVTNPVTGQTIGNTTIVGIPAAAITAIVSRATILATPPETPTPPASN